MRGPADIADLLAGEAGFRHALGLVESLALPDAWIGAGFVRNAVWDALHGRRPDLGRLDDIDVIFFDPADPARDRDTALEHRLRRLDAAPAWSVKNQARMHLRNGDRPYRDTLDAIAHWPETATAVAARLVHGRVEILAPWGVDDLLDLVLRPTPAFRHKMDVYRKRLAAKDWLSRWPKLTVLPTRDGPYP
ncbi:nucleotidyltransferase family protein [Microvirga sp. GCM10011540]|uniref:nucleotidyltransferase family protein n=1 Tax=Microvirga sp. GCM10011540 TaxID=3317338 RepID=UPI00361294E9